MPSSQNRVKKELSIIKRASVVTLVLCVFLLSLGKYYQNNDNLLTAFILCVTSVIIVIIYYIGARRFLRIFNDNGGMNE